MFRTTFVLAVLLAFGFLLGCGRDKPAEVAQNKESKRRSKKARRTPTPKSQPTGLPLNFQRDRIRRS